MMRGLAVATLALMASAAFAQAPPADFPAQAQPIAAEALKQRMAGKVFSTTVANGNVWRLQFDSNGYYFVNISPSGYSDSGKWRTEESKLCTEPQKTQAACNDVRLVGETIHLRRVNGEVVKMEQN